MGKYELSMDHFFRDFMIVTDSAAVMARVGNAYVFRKINAAVRVSSSSGRKVPYFLYSSFK